MELNRSLNEDFQRAKWPPAQAQIMDQFQTDFDQVSWSQNAIFDIGFAIYR